METMPIKETIKFGQFGKRANAEDDVWTEVRWERHIRAMPDVEATVERISGCLPWTHAVEFESDGAHERWLLRGFSPATQIPVESS